MARFRHASAALASLALLVVACSSSSKGGAAGPAPLAPSQSSIKHVIIVVQENKSFDSYYGRWCTAAPGSNPTCTSGQACCEAAPDKEPSGSAPIVLDDTENAAYSPKHTQSCETDVNDGGKMDKFVTSTVCGSPHNFAIVDETLIKPYRDLLPQAALADHYFQPVTGQSWSNGQYLVRATFAFQDNEIAPTAAGVDCDFSTTKQEIEGQTIGDLLDQAGVSWTYYAERYQDTLDAAAHKSCAAPTADCPAKLPSVPCDYTPGDNPFQYYERYKDNPAHDVDYAQLAKDLANGTLPSVAWVKPVDYHSEHPGLGEHVSDGIAWGAGVVAAVEASPYAASTLVILTYDESGGYYDHLAPPATSAVDHQPYGARVPTLAIGPFAKKNSISHAVLEHSSLVKFIEWNWLGGKTGQLGARDAVVNDIGDLLDPAATGATVPSN